MLEAGFDVFLERQCDPLNRRTNDHCFGSNVWVIMPNRSRFFGSLDHCFEADFRVEAVSLIFAKN